MTGSFGIVVTLDCRRPDGPAFRVTAVCSRGQSCQIAGSWPWSPPRTVLTRELTALRQQSLSASAEAWCGQQPVAFHDAANDTTATARRPAERHARIPCVGLRRQNMSHHPANGRQRHRGPAGVRSRNDIGRNRTRTGHQRTFSEPADVHARTPLARGNADARRSS